MNFVKTKWHDENPNNWVAVNKDTYELVDRDDSLTALYERIYKAGLIDSVTFDKNWFSSHHKET